MKLYMKYIGLMLLVAMVMFVSYSPAVLAAPGDTQLVAAPDNRQTYISAAPPVKPQNQANTGSILVDIAGAPTKKVNTTIIGYIITS
ncbi:MAG: hypothetical protein HGA22_13115, partial [Clostridiales bacterium]|nr:hypothetical protein [Clostridiales bacterium]